MGKKGAQGESQPSKSTRRVNATPMQMTRPGSRKRSMRALELATADRQFSSLPRGLLFLRHIAEKRMEGTCWPTQLPQYALANLSTFTAWRPHIGQGPTGLGSVSSGVPSTLASTSASIWRPHSPSPHHGSSTTPPTLSSTSRASSMVETAPSSMPKLAPSGPP